MNVWAGRRGEQQRHSCLWISSLLMSLVWHGSTEAVSTPRLQTTSLSNPQSGRTHSPRGQRTCLVHSPSWFIPFLTYPYRLRCNPWQHAGLMLTEFWFRGRKNKKTLLVQLLHQNTTEQLLYLFPVQPNKYVVVKMFTSTTTASGFPDNSWGVGGAQSVVCSSQPPCSSTKMKNELLTKKGNALIHIFN